MKLSAPQYVFLEKLQTKYRAYIGGFGSGKTFVGCVDLLNFFARYPKTVQGYFGPSYPSIRDVFYPTFEEASDLLGFTIEVKEGNKEVHVYRGGFFYGTIICRSMDRPGSIIGFKIAHALVDEIDTLPKRKATQAWQKIIARLRLVIDGVENGVGVATTPEGFGFVYERFAREPSSSYSMVQASSYENEEHLPPDYISSLIETYPETLVKAYIHGLFVNLTHGTVHRSFNRHLNGSSETIRPSEALAIGMDFNVGKMAATVFVERADGYHCCAEVKKGLDTPWMIDHLKSRFAGHPITVYPDASGGSASSKGASLSDIKLLREAGFAINAPKKNPRIKDRIASVNNAFEKKKLWINVEAAPEVTRCLEQQAYDDNGEPDKTSDLDHLPETVGYFCHSHFPIIKPVLFTGLRSAR